MVQIVRRTLRSFFLRTFVTVSLLLGLLSVGSAQETYLVTAIWPVLSQPWYFLSPHAVATDPTGAVFISDVGYHRIQKYDADGTCIREWGSQGIGNGQFNYPFGIAVGSSGQVYVADYANHRIQKFDSDGNYLGQWGSFGAGEGQFKYPRGIAASASGFVYVSDEGNHRIQKFDSSGTYVMQWGSYGSGSGQFAAPNGLAVDGSGNVYVADTNNHRIQKFDQTGDHPAEWGSHGSANGQFISPHAVTIDALGNVNVADTGNDRIQRFDQDGTFLLSWGGRGSGVGEFNSPVGIAADGDGNIYVTDLYNNRIQRFDMNGAPVAQWTSSGSGAGEMNVPKDMAVSETGSVYVADFGNNRIQRFDGQGVYAGEWGTQGTGNGQFNGPSGVATDSLGNVFVIDVNNHRIQKFDAGGSFLLQWGSDGTGDGQFKEASGIVVDGWGSVYVTDTVTHRVQNFDAMGNYITQWGTFGAGVGQFKYPRAISVDGFGNVYVADMYNNRIQKFDSSGTYLSEWGSLGSGNGQLNGPIGVATDNLGDVFVLDSGNRRIQKFDAFGTYITQWGSFGWSPGQFNNALAVKADGLGNVYVADTGNNRIQKFTLHHLLAVNSDGGGSGSVSSGTIGLAYSYPATQTASAYVSFHDAVTLTASATSGSGALWSGNCDSTGGTLTLTTCTITDMNAAKTVKATFVITYTVNGSVAGGVGSVSCMSPVVSGGSSTCTITAGTGFHLGSLVDNSVDVTPAIVNDTYVITTILTDHVVEATFLVDTFTVTSAAGPHGTISPSGPEIVDYNNTVTFTVTPDSGYHIFSVSGCSGTLAGSVYTTGLITADCTVSALFHDVTPPGGGSLGAQPGNGQILLAWSGFSDSGSGLRDTDTYKIVRSSETFPDSLCTSGSQVFLGTGGSITDGDLTNGQQYFYRVCAYDNAGNVSAGTTATATPSAAGKITGTVKDDVGDGIANVKIRVYDLNRSVVSDALTDVSGAYTVDGIPEGSYKVQFKGCASGYRNQWFAARSGFDAADALILIAGGTAQGIDADLAGHSVSFNDVPFGHWAETSIKAIHCEGITGGCSAAPLNYCPGNPVTREQMAAFIVRAKDGGDPAGGCGAPLFQDVPQTSMFCKSIERFAALGITGGCGNGNYCPQTIVTREQMAAFIIRAVEGEPTGMCATAPFNDVPESSPFCRHIERMAALGITGGCGNGNYCPQTIVTRDQMAVFLARAFLDMP